MATEGLMPLKMVSPDGRVVEFNFHPSLVGQMRHYYEKKGWTQFVEPILPPDEPEEGHKKRGRKPAEE